MLVSDDEFEFTTVGTTVPPNLFRATGPAIGDAVLFTIDFEREDIHTQIIVNSNFQRLVTGQKNPSQLSLGLSICHSGARTAVEMCGPIGSLSQTVSFVFENNDTFPPTLLQKQVRNNVCFSTTAMQGDSGAGVYQKSGSTDAFAVALLSSASSSNVWGTPINRIATDTGSHLWLGDGIPT